MVIWSIKLVLPKKMLRFAQYGLSQPSDLVRPCSCPMREGIDSFTVVEDEVAAWEEDAKEGSSGVLLLVSKSPLLSFLHQRLSPSLL